MSDWGGIGYRYGEGTNRQVMIDATLKQGVIPTPISQTPNPVTELDNAEWRYIFSHVCSSLYGDAAVTEKR